jgi:hypothetical protein
VHFFFCIVIFIFYYYLLFYDAKSNTNSRTRAGETYESCWPTVWEEHKQALDKVMKTKRANWQEDVQMSLDRNGFLEECYFTLSYSPLISEDGTVRGVYSAVTESTWRVIVDRQRKCVPSPTIIIIIIIIILKINAFCVDLAFPK